MSTAELRNVLSAADTADYDLLPEGWEMMISPEGLEYYVDHGRRVSACGAPGFAFTPLLARALTHLMFLKSTPGCDVRCVVL
jgi:hypothetical protein